MLDLVKPADTGSVSSTAAPSAPSAGAMSMFKLEYLIVPAILLAFYLLGLKDKNQMTGPARIIIPFALVVTLVAGLMASNTHTAGWLLSVFPVLFVPAVLVVLIICFADMGWSTLARQYRERLPFTGSWSVPRTFHMSLVSIDDPKYGRLKARFVGTLRFAAAEDGMHVATLASYVPVLNRMLPCLCIPWGAVISARAFEAPGWVTGGTSSGALIQATYDPGFKGQFLELKVGEPPVYLQMPADLLGDKINRLPLESGA